MTRREGTTGPERVQAIMAPRSIAIVGASDRIGPARKVLANLKTVGFEGPVYLVNRSKRFVDNIPTFPSLEAVPDPPDLVVVAVNSAASVEVVASAARIGSRGVVLLAAGFDETGDGGAQLTKAVVAARGELSLIGPNCLGFVNLEDRVAAYSGPLVEPAIAGVVGLISNSGAMACSLTGAASERNIRFSYVVTTGNQLDLGVVEFVGYLAARPNVRVIACYLEGFEDGRGLLEAFALASEVGKCVIVLKAGRSAAGGEAARTHTGVLAGSAVVQADLFAQHRVLMAADPEEFLALIELAGTIRRPIGTRIGAITISGGERLLLADAGEEIGVSFAPLAEATSAELKRILPSYATVANPLDTTGAGIVEGEPKTHAAAALVMARDPNVDLLLACQDVKNGWGEEARTGQLFLDGVVAAHQAGSEAGKVVVVISPTTGEVDARAREYLFKHSLPCLMGLRPGMLAIAKYLRPESEVTTSPRRTSSPVGEVSAATWLSNRDVIERLSSAGIRFWPTRYARTLSESIRAADELGYPVVLKLEGQIPHRTRFGGVRVGLRNANAVEVAWEELLKAASANDLDVSELAVQAMAFGVAELFVGGLVDEQFGPIVLVGFGGTEVELGSDVVVGLAPLGLDEAEELIGRAPCYDLLGRLGGHGNEVRTEIARVVSAVSQMITEAGVRAIDINPLLVLSGDIAVVDAKIVVDTGPGESRAPLLRPS